MAERPVCAACPVDTGRCPECGTVWERRDGKRVGYPAICYEPGWRPPVVVVEAPLSEGDELVRVRSLRREAERTRRWALDGVKLHPGDSALRELSIRLDEAADEIADALAAFRDPDPKEKPG